MTTPDRWKRIQEVFSAALERTPEARPDFLSRECQGDADLAREVKALLASHNEASSAFMESPAIGLGSGVQGSSRAALTRGSRLGPYEILSPLGAGGMGEVYRARDSKLKRDVAIKVLPQALAADPDALGRFEREALAVATLSHPNILSIFDFGDQDGVAYAVMELLEGETLRSRLDVGQIPQRQAVDYALQVARGLSAAHQKGVVHRDLKPENLFVTKDGHVKILDFGLAKMVGPSAPGEETAAPTISDRTEPGTVMGTVGYMSPEQVRGLPVDHRSDIFSFGAILYELLSGRRAFKRDTVADTMAAIMKEEPPELTESGRNVSPALDHIVKHCLEKDRDNRFQSAGDIAFALGESSSFPAGSGVEPARTPAGSRTILLGVALLALVALVASFLLRRSTGSATRAVEVKRVAVLPFENLGDPADEYLADGIADAVRVKLTSLPGIQVIARGSSTPYKKTTKSPGQIGQELDVGYLLTATVRWQKRSGSASRVEVSPELVEVSGAGPPTSKWQQPFDASLTDVFQVQSDIASRVAQALGVALEAKEERRLEATPTQNLAAYDAFLKGEKIWNKLGEHLSLGPVRDALALYEQAVALDPAFALAWARVSTANSWLDDGMNKEVQQRARAAAEKSIALAPGASAGYVALGEYLDSVAGDRTAALEQFKEAWRLSPSDAAALASAGSLEFQRGEVKAGLDHLQQAVRLDPRSARARGNLGFALLYLRRPVEARAVLDGGLAFAPADIFLLETKIDTFLSQGDLAGARGVITAATEAEPAELVARLGSAWDLAWALEEPQRELLLRLTPSAFRDDRAVWGLTLAQACALKGDAARVREYAEEAAKAYEAQIRLLPENAGTAQNHVLYGQTLAYLGRKEDATREGELAMKLQPLAAGDFVAPYNQHQLVRIYMLVGEPEKALDKLEPLMKVPYVLTPAWLRIDPNFDPLRQNPRFQKLVARSN